MFELDGVIRALGEGDGAEIERMRPHIRQWLLELRRFRDLSELRCGKCERSVIGRKPVCGGCR